MKKKHILSLILFTVYCSSGTGPANQAPEITDITASPSVIFPGEFCTLTVTATDAESDDLTYSWSVDGGSLSSVSGISVIWTAPDLPDTYTVTCNVNDGNTTSNGSIDIEVNSAEEFVPEMVFIQGGEFEMGDITGNGQQDERPVHTVSLSDFYMSTFEVTNTEFCVFLNNVGQHSDGDEIWIDINDNDCQISENGGIYNPISGKENHPVGEVSLYGAVAYCDWLTSISGDIYRLPTEAEWEYACRAGSTGDFCFGSNENLLCDYAWYFGNTAGEGVLPVGQKQPNSWGLYDLHGNIWEWCSDRYDADYYQECFDSGTVTNPTGPSSGNVGVIRGGDWLSGSIFLRSSERTPNYPNATDGHIGFRCIKES